MPKMYDKEGPPTMKKPLSSGQRAVMTAVGAFLALTGAGFAGALSLFYLPVTEELGFTQTSFSAYMTIMSLCGIFSHPLEGRLMVRYGHSIRLIVLFGGVLGFLCYVLWSLSSSLWLFYLGGALMSFVLPIVSVQLAGSVVSQWFRSRRSVVLSLTTVGMSLGTVLYSQVARWFIDAFGWRSAYLAMGVLFLAVTAVSSLLISPPPEALGMEPYGRDEPRSVPHPAASGMTLKQALHTPGFWLFSLAAALSSIYLMGIQQGLAPIFQVDFGMTVALSASLISLYSLVCALAKPLSGVIYEKAGLVFTNGYLCLMLLTALLLLFFSLSSAAAAAAMVFLGLGNIFGSVVISNFVADEFGSRAYSAVIGYVNIFFTLGAAAGPVLSGWLADLFGSYRPACLVFSACCLASAVLTFAAHRSLDKWRVSADPAR